MALGDETAAGEPRTISKGFFECLVFLTLILITIAELLSALVASLALGVRIQVSWIGGLGLLNYILARLAVDGLLKRFGMSRSGKTREIRGRTVALAEGEVADDEVVELRIPSWLTTTLGVMSLGFSLVILLILPAIPGAQNDTVVWADAIMGFMGLGGVYFLIETRWGKPQAWADWSGVTGYPVGFHVSRRFVPWSDVATCEIETDHDTFGKPVILRPILKGWYGEVLLTLNLRYTEMEDQERLVKYIRAKLPKSKEDFWE